MRTRNLVTSAAGLVALVLVGVATTAARRGERVLKVDFDKVVTASQPAFDARLAPP